LDLRTNSFALLDTLLREHGYSLLVTRASVGEKIVAVVKPIEKL